MKRKRSKEELERIRREAESHPRVRQLRELEARGRAELEARPEGTESRRSARHLGQEERRVVHRGVRDDRDHVAEDEQDARGEV